MSTTCLKNIGRLSVRIYRNPTLRPRPRPSSISFANTQLPQARHMSSCKKDVKNKTAQDWQKELTPEQYCVAREGGTEPLKDQVWVWLRLALISHCRRGSNKTGWGKHHSCRNTYWYFPQDGADRSLVQKLQGSPGSCVSWWTWTNWSSLLH